MFRENKTFIIIIVIIILLQCNFLFSQNKSLSPTFGIKGGILLSTVTGDEAIDKYAKKGSPQIGVTGAYYTHPRLSLRAEINYDPKGGNFSNHDMKMNLNYISLPLYLKFNFTKDPEIYVYGGGYGSYLLSAKTKGTYEIIIGDDYISETINEDIKPNLKQFDTGVLGGLGVQGRYNHWVDIFLDFRYTVGFIDINNNSAKFRYNFNHVEFWPEQDYDKPKNKAFMFTAGLIIYIYPR